MVFYYAIVEIVFLSFPRSKLSEASHQIHDTNYPLGLPTSAWPLGRPHIELAANSQFRQGLIVRLGKFILPKDGGYMQEMRSSRRSLCMRGIGERGNKDRSPP